MVFCPILSPILGLLIFNHPQSIDNFALLVDRNLLKVQMRFIDSFHACVTVILKYKNVRLEQM